VKILFATNHFWDYTGSELNLIGLSRALAARGHEVACHALFITPRMRAGIQGMGLRLVAKDELAAFAPDAVFCQHHSAAAMVRGRLPHAPMVLAHLGVEPELEQAPLVDCGVGLHLAISEEVRDALIAQKVPAEKIRIFRNAIDTSVLDARRDPGARQAALLFSYKLSSEVSSLISSVTAQFGMALDSSSLATHGLQKPAEVAARLGAARLVFASGRSALEAALSGAAVVVLGPKGLDGALTAATWRTLAESNFSGRRHASALTPESVRQAMSESLQSDVEATRTQLHAEFGLDGRAENLERLLSASRPPAMSGSDLAIVRRLSRLLDEQRALAIQQSGLEQPANRARWWSQLVPRMAR
jgi:hypothetical protein